MKRVLAVLVGLTFALAAAAQNGPKVVTAQGKFVDVKDDVVAAIVQRGLVVNFVAHVGEMLERTGRDLGMNKRLYDQAEVIEFCSATVSRKMMDADAHNLAYCPYTIAVYTLPGKPDKVYLVRREYPETAALKPVVRLLDDIIAEAAK